MGEGFRDYVGLAWGIKLLRIVGLAWEVAAEVRELRLVAAG